MLMFYTTEYWVVKV